MIKKISCLVVVFFLFSGIIYAQTYVINSKSSKNLQISIPEEALNYTSEKELIEALCYEAKWKGGEGIAKIEALDELISPVLENITSLGILIDSINLESKTYEMRQKLEEVCNAENVDESIEKINEYFSFSHGLKNVLQGDFTNNLKKIEKDLKNKGEELKIKLEKELGIEAEEMSKKAEEELRRKGKEESEALEFQLKELGKEFENFMLQGDVGFEDAQAKANQLVGKISTDSETRIFISSKFNEILNEAVGVVPAVMSGQISPSEIKVRIDRKIPGIVQEIKSFMIQKYENLGKQEEEKIRSLLEGKANEIGGEEKEALEKIRIVFEKFEERLESLSREKMSEWNKYEQMSKGKKREIISKSIEHHFEKAKKAIENRKDDINMAFEFGVADEYGIIPYNDLLQMIEKDKLEIINELSSTEFNSELIEKTKKKFQTKWNNYREKMEKIEIIGDGTLESVLRKYWDENRVDWSSLARRIDIGITNIESLDRYLSKTHQNHEICLNKGSELTPKMVQEKILNEKINVRSKEAIELRSLCRDCEILKELNGMGFIWLEKVNLEEMKSKATQAKSDFKKFENILNSYSNERHLPINQASISLNVFFKVKDDLISAKSYFEEIGSLSQEVSNIYKSVHDKSSSSCWGR